jgi:ABC-type transport system involved in cytochrome bd biosynthesis fused ATPase/permease subunit
MESLLLPMWNLIVFLIELAVVLLLIDAIMSIIGGIFGFSWKKVLMWAAAVFGILWLRDFLKKRKETAQKEIVTEITDADFENVDKE